MFNSYTVLDLNCVVGEIKVPVFNRIRRKSATSLNRRFQRVVKILKLGRSPRLGPHKYCELRIGGLVQLLHSHFSRAMGVFHTFSL